MQLVHRPIFRALLSTLFVAAMICFVWIIVTLLTGAASWASEFTTGIALIVAAMVALMCWAHFMWAQTYWLFGRLRKQLARQLGDHPMVHMVRDDDLAVDIMRHGYVGEGSFLVAVNGDEYTVTKRDVMPYVMINVTEEYHGAKFDRKVVRLRMGDRRRLLRDLVRLTA